MPYIQNTEREVKEMLEAIGVSSIEDLFKDIPAGVRVKGNLNLPSQMSELELLRHIESLASKNRTVGDYVSFLGAGVYNHFIPAVIDHLAGAIDDFLIAVDFSNNIFLDG